MGNSTLCCNYKEQTQNDLPFQMSNNQQQSLNVSKTLQSNIHQAKAIANDHGTPQSLRGLNEIMFKLEGGQIKRYMNRRGSAKQSSSEEEENYISISKDEYYKYLIKSMEITQLFDTILRDDLNKPWSELKEGFVKIQSEEKPQRYSMHCKELKINGEKHHEIVQQVENTANPLDQVYFQMLADIEDKKICDTSLNDFQLLHYIEKDGVEYFFNRHTTKKILMLKGKELLIITAMKKLANGNYQKVYQSYDDIHFPVTNSFDRISILKGGALFECLEKDKIRLTYTHIVNPRTSMNLSFIKGFLRGYYKRFYKEETIMFNKYMENGKNDWKAQLKARFPLEN